MELGWTMEQLIRDVGRLSRLMMQLAGPDVTRSSSGASLVASPILAMAGRCGSG
jgi:hypothetical protein